MTLIDELLILIDDSPGLDKEKIIDYFPDKTKQAVYSGMGRLAKKGMIKNEKNTVLGKEYLDSTLLFLNRKNKDLWQNGWKLIFFNIAEKERGKRDIWRKHLKNNGFGILREGVWIMPKDCEGVISKLAEKLKITQQIFVLTSDLGKHPNLVNIINQGWEWDIIKKQYQNFLKKASKELKNLKKENRFSTFLAKKIVFRYAQTLQSEPSFPDQISPISSFSARANDLYQKIRPYCYK